MKFLTVLIALVAVLLTAADSNAQRRGNRVEQLNINNGGGNVSVSRQFGLFGNLRREQIRVNNNVGLLVAPAIRQNLRVQQINVNTYAAPAVVQQIRQIRVQPVIVAPQQVIVKQRLQLNQLNSYSTVPYATATNLQPILQTQYVQAPQQIIQPQYIQAPQPVIQQDVQPCPSCAPAAIQAVIAPQYYTLPIVAPVIQYQRRLFISRCY